MPSNPWVSPRFEHAVLWHEVSRLLQPCEAEFYPDKAVSLQYEARVPRACWQLYRMAVLESNGNSKTRAPCCHMRSSPVQLSNDIKNTFNIDHKPLTLVKVRKKCSL